MQAWGVKDALQPTLAASVGLPLQRTSMVGCCSAARIVVLEMMDEPCKPKQDNQHMQAHKAASKSQATVIRCPA